MPDKPFIPVLDDLSGEEQDLEIDRLNESIFEDLRAWAAAPCTDSFHAVPYSVDKGIRVIGSSAQEFDRNRLLQHMQDFAYSPTRDFPLQIGLIGSVPRRKSTADDDLLVMASTIRGLDSHIRETVRPIWNNDHSIVRCGGRMAGKSTLQKELMEADFNLAFIRTRMGGSKEEVETEVEAEVVSSHPKSCRGEYCCIKNQCFNYLTTKKYIKGRGLRFYPSFLPNIGYEWGNTGHSYPPSQAGSSLTCPGFMRIWVR